MYDDVAAMQLCGGTIAVTRRYRCADCVLAVRARWWKRLAVAAVAVAAAGSTYV